MFLNICVNYKSSRMKTYIIPESCSFDLLQKSAFMDVYTNVGLIALVFGIALALLSPFLKKGMHGIN